MSESIDQSEAVAISLEYFRRLDAGNPNFVELFTEDVQIFFPKFGIGKGKAALFELGSGLTTVLASVVHDIDTFLYFVSGNRLTVEGTTRGTTKSGTNWSGGETPGGRFCSVFEFRGNLISRMHIYLDPDYGSDDHARFLWGQDGRKW